jgi:raffinose/stachyose/melibiose transport system permease protein
MAVGTVLVTTDATSPKASKRAPRARGGMTKKRGVDWLLLALVIVGALAVLAPFYLILVNSFKSPIDYANGGPLALPVSLDFTGIVTFWERVNFPEKVWNSIFISGVVAVLAVLISMLNAFAIGIGRVRGRTWIVLLFLMANLLPQEALLYPLYYMFKEVGLYDNVWSVIIIFTVVQAAFGTYLLASVLGTFPKEVLEAASIDGASRMGALIRVVFPLALPGIAVASLFVWLYSWNEFLYARLLTTTQNNLPLQVFQAIDRGSSQEMATVAAVLTLPILFVVYFLQRYLRPGALAGAVKG